MICPHYNPHDICPECQFRSVPECYCCLKKYPVKDGNHRNCYTCDHEEFEGSQRPRNRCNHIIILQDNWTPKTITDRSTPH